MSDKRPVCLPISDAEGRHHGWMIQCPGCGHAHVFDQRWKFNGDQVKPTFDGSYLQHRSPQWPESPSHGRCHSFVKEGRIQFLGDCDHALKGQTVDLKPFDCGE